MSSNVKVIPPKKIFEVGDLVLVDPLYIGDALAAQLYFLGPLGTQTHPIQEETPTKRGQARPWPWGIVIEANISTPHKKIQYKISFGHGEVWVDPTNLRHIENDA